MSFRGWDTHADPRSPVRPAMIWSGRRQREYDRWVVLRCTKRLLAIIGPALAAGPAPAPSPEDWYANLPWFGRRKCLLLTHSATLFSVFEADVRAADLRATHSLLTRLIGRELVRENLPPATFPIGEPDEFTIAKTADRSVLGCMSGMAFLCEMTIGDSGGLARTDLPALNHALRRNINSARSYQHPIDLAVQHLNNPRQKTVTGPAAPAPHPQPDLHQEM
jgi:hypothetical protein